MNSDDGPASGAGFDDPDGSRGGLRVRIGLFGGPFVLLALLAIPLPGLAPEAHRLFAILGLVVMLWVTEAIPLAVTALLGPCLCVVAGIGPAREVFRGFADPIIFLFLGSFLLAEAMFHHGLNRRVAFRVLGLAWVGENPTRLLAAFTLITALVSMWISNTSTTAMMYPIAASILSEMARRQSERTGRPMPFTALPYGTAMMLAAAFASSIGGIGTPVGSPPNLIGLGMVQKHLKVHISFFEWMSFGVPLVIVLTAALVLMLNRFCPADAGLLSGSADWIRAEKARLGPLRRGEQNVLVAFAFTVSLWLTPGVLGLVCGQESPAVRWFAQCLPEGVVALLGAGLLFILPVSAARSEFTLGWGEAKRIDWSTILLFGGGLSLGELMFNTGLGAWIGHSLTAAVHAKSVLGLTMLFTAVAILITETTSNTASATMVVPIAIAVSQACGADPLKPALGACLGASMAFMLPVSTPPNAIVYGSGCVRLSQMIKYGVLLDLVAYVVIVAAVTWLLPSSTSLTR